MLRIFSLIFATIGFIYLVLFVTGYLIPEEYNNETTFSVDFSPRDIILVLTDVEKIPDGKSEVDSVEILGKYRNLYSWIENLNTKNYRKFRHIKIVENKEVVIEMTESSYGVTGSWVFIFDEKENDTEVTIIEKSKNQSILNRGVRFYFGQNKETNDWLKLIRVRLFGLLLTTP